jgi:hypothetical protein
MDGSFRRMTSININVRYDISLSRQRNESSSDGPTTAERINECFMEPFLAERPLPRGIRPWSVTERGINGSQVRC